MITPVPPELTQVAVETAAAAQVAHGAEPSVLGALGIDWRIFVAQLINFGIILFVMWFVYKPILKIINARTAKIDKGLKDAEAAAAAKAGAEKAAEGAILIARREAQRMLEEAQHHAEAERAEIKAKTQAELAVLIQQGKDALVAEKEKMVRDARAEIAELAVEAAKKALGATVTDTQKKALLEEVTDYLKS